MFWRNIESINCLKCLKYYGEPKILALSYNSAKYHMIEMCCTNARAEIEE